MTAWKRLLARLTAADATRHSYLLDGTAAFSGLNRKANEAAFIAVYPNGTGSHSSLFWNGGGPVMNDKVDDVAFIDALLDDLGRAYPSD